MWSRQNLVLFLACVPLTAGAQVFRGLTYTDRAPISIKKAGYAVQLPMKCGPDGTIYVRFAEAGKEPAVTLIRQDGKILSSIRLSAIPELSESGLYDFAPATGEVWLLSGKGKPYAPTTYQVSRFKSDGTYISSATLDLGFRPDFEPKEIAAFPSGNLLVAGIVKGHDVPFAPFTAIFGDDGQFRRQVTLEKDVTDKDATQQATNANFPWAQQIRNLLDGTYLQAADDGNAYLMRHTPTGPVFVISPGGAARRVLLTPPVQGADLQWIMASGGSIVAHYRLASAEERKEHYLVVLDAWTKKNRETIRYEFDYPNNAGGMACYQSGSYTFIAGGPEGGLQLVRAVAQ